MDPAAEPSSSATDLPIHVRVWGAGPRVVLVHDAMTNGERTWEKQRPLSARWTLVVPDRRGSGESPGAESCDFEVDAGDVDELLGEGAHLVGHSYGGVVALFAAARRPVAALAPDATRLVLTGRGHAVHRMPELNDHLESFWTIAQRTPPS